MNCFRCLYHESHRCRNEKTCPDGMAYVEYTGSIVRQCLLATTEIFQDGYVHCPILESIGCVECEKRFGDGSGWERDESQNYERKPKWREDEVKDMSKDKTAEDREILSKIIGKEIKTHYNTGGIVTNIIGPHNAYGPNSWTINYTKDGKKSKNPCIINSIKVENGIITCDGRPLQIIESAPEITCIGCTYWPPKGSTKCNRIGVDREVTENSVRCGWYHNVKTGEMGPLMYEESYGEPMPAESEINIDNAQPAKETSVEDTALEVPVSNNVQPFDYSTVDDETAAFLQEKAKKITQMRITFMLSVAIELEEVHTRLANHYKGTFGIWCESIGITDRTARNYLSALDWVRKNFPNIDDAEKIQPSLLFAASKPSAPKELQEAVLAGDITSHKQYKELEQRLKAVEERAERAINQKFVAENKAIEAEQKCRKAEKDRDDSIRAFERDINNLRQQLEQAKRNGDSSKVQELGKRIADYQAEVESLEEDKKTLNQEINNLRKQLKEKPIEVPASKIVEKEVIPDEVALAIYDKVARLYEGLERLTDKEIQVFAEQVEADYYDEISSGIENAICVLEKIKFAAYKETHKENNSEPSGHCGDCAHADMDGVTDEQLDDCKTLCTLTGEIVDFDHTCGKYKRYGG